MSTVVRSILDQQGRLTRPADGLLDDDNLHAVGLDSMAMVNVMLALEQALDIEFPEALMTRQAFSSISALDNVLKQLTTSPTVLDRPATGHRAAGHRVGV